MKLNWTLGVMGTVGILVFTNPSKDLYSDYFAAEVIAQAPDTFCPQANLSDSEEARFMNLISTLCKSLTSYGASFLLRGEMKHLIKQQTVRHNLFVCSLYTTRIPGKTVKMIGVLNTFVPYSVE